MIKYTCVVCKEEYTYEYISLIDNHFVCSQCLWDELWKTKDPKKPVLDLIDSLQNEVRRAAGNDFYDNIYSAMEVHDMLDEIEKTLKEV